MAARITNSVSCQGEIIDYDARTQCGLIKGFDQNGYGFVLSEWKAKDKDPRVGMIVSFNISHNENFREAVSIRPG